jgi:hypothetical protein
MYRLTQVLRLAIVRARPQKNPVPRYVIYSHSAQTINAHFAGGKYRISQISPVKGTIKELSKQVFIANDYHLNADKGDNVYWIEKM